MAPKPLSTTFPFLSNQAQPFLSLHLTSPLSQFPRTTASPPTPTNLQERSYHLSYAMHELLPEDLEGLSHSLEKG